MKCKFILSLNFFLLVAVFSFAQQEMQVTHNMFNQMDINPGFAGINGKICATIIHRNQWMSFPGSPVTTLFSLDAPIFKSFGVGVNYMQDQLGAETNKVGKINLAYHLKLNNGGTLGLGVAGAFNNTYIDFTKFLAGDAIANNTTTTTDPRLLPASKASTFMIDLSFGAFYKVPDNYYLGFSSSQLMQSKKDIGNSNFELKRHYYLTGGKEFPLQSMPLKLVPSLLIKSDMSSTQFDLNCLAIWKDKYWAGLTYRFQDAVALLVGGQPFAQSNKKALSDLTIGFSYDLTTSAMSSGHGSLEFMLGYCFKISKPVRVESYRNTIYL